MNKSLLFSLFLLALASFPILANANLIYNGLFSQFNATDMNLYNYTSVDGYNFTGSGNIHNTTYCQGKGFSSECFQTGDILSNDFYWYSYMATNVEWYSRVNITYGGSAHFCIKVYDGTLGSYCSSGVCIGSGTTTVTKYSTDINSSVFAGCMINGHHYQLRFFDNLYQGDPIFGQQVLWVDNISLSSGGYSDCFNITSSGTYNLGNTINSFAGDYCIRINSSNVILDLKNYTIYSNPTQTAILVDGVSNVRIEYGKIQSLPTGNGNTIILNNSNSVILNNIHSIGNIQFYNTNFSIIEGSILSGNGFGAYLEDTSNNNIIGNSGFYDIYGMVFLDTYTYDNLICNAVFGFYPYKADYGTNNTYSDTCPPSLTSWGQTEPPCTNFTGWQCVAVDKLANVDAWCNYNDMQTCEYGCDISTSSCNSPPPTGRDTKPTILGLQSPVSYFILFVIVVLGVSGYLEYRTKSHGKVFIGASILLLFAGSMIKVGNTQESIIPLWIPILFSVIAGLVAFKFFGGKE